VTFTKRDDIGQRSWERSLSAEQVAIRRQEEEMSARNRTCFGCIFILTSPFGGPEVACRKRQRAAKKRIEDTRRCEIHTTCGVKNERNV
jgi:hypothetical protein